MVNMAAETEFIFSIGVVAKMLDISVETIRMYEREGLILTYKEPSGHRRYCQKDVDRLRCIRDMITEKGLNIEGIRRMMSMIPCWRIYEHCTDEKRSQCPAYTQSTAPCWALETKPEICMNQDCYHCPVYQMHIECDQIKSLYHKDLNTSSLSFEHIKN